MKDGVPSENSEVIIFLCLDQKLKSTLIMKWVNLKIVDNMQQVCKGEWLKIG